MENGVLKVAAGQGKRKRDHGFLSEEDVKDNLKVQQQWQQRTMRTLDSGTKQGFQYPQFQGGPPPVVDNRNRMQQQEQQKTSTDVAAAATANVPPFNMQQKVTAASALQDLRSCSDPSKLFLQCQLQQQKQGKYGIQQQQQQQQQQACSEAIAQLPAPTTPAARSLQEHLPSQLGPLPGLLPPLIQSSTLYAGSDLRNGPPSSSSSNPYANLQTATVLCACNNNPIQLLEAAESDQASSYSGCMFHGSQNGFLQQGLKNALPQASVVHSSSDRVVAPLNQQLSSVHNAQIVGIGHHQQGGGALMSCSSGVLQQQQQQGSQNNRPQSSTSQTQNGQNGAIVNGTSQHLSHNSQRIVHQKSPNNGLQNGLQNGMQTGLDLGFRVDGDLQSNGMMQQQQQQQGAAQGLQNAGVGQQQGTGHLPSQHLPMHLSQNGIQNRMPQQEGFSGGNNHVMLRELPVPASWYSSVREPCTYTGAQPKDRPSTSGSSMGGPLYSPSFGPEFGTHQRGPMSMPPPQGPLGQCQGVSRDGGNGEQESQAQCPLFDMQSTNPLVSLGSTKACPSVPTSRQSKMHSLRSEVVHGDQRLVQGPYCSSSSSGVEQSLFGSALSTNANEGGMTDNSLFLQGGSSCPPKVVRSFTKVYKLGSITRTINVNRFSNYAELQCELVDMFNLEGQLDQEHGWQLVFRDNEDDLLLVGDDPWEVFVSTVRAIHILSPAEVNFYLHEQNPGLAYNSFAGGTSKQH